MISDNSLRKQLAHVLTDTNFHFLGEAYRGKVRDNYTQDRTRYLITSDRLSCFDVVVTSIPFKGQVLTQLAALWFEKTKEIIENHLIDLPDPNVMVVKKCEVLPVEVIMRAYLAGSAWRDYESGKPISGVTLPPGLRSSEKLPEILITPSTKAAKGSHDEPISEKEILARNLVDKNIWQQAKEAAQALFQLGIREAASRGLILVDTKYEFGLWEGKLLLVDEIHTLDSSRYWIQKSYLERFEKGQSPEMLDKEPTRQWLLSQGYKGNGPIPEFSEEHRVKIARHYIDSFERISGLEFSAEVGDVRARIEHNLRSYLGQ